MNEKVLIAITIHQCPLPIPQKRGVAVVIPNALAGVAPIKLGGSIAALA